MSRLVRHLWSHVRRAPEPRLSMVGMCSRALAGIGLVALAISCRADQPLQGFPHQTVRDIAAPPQQLRETLHGVEVEDPFRWLERSEKELEQWLASQSALSRSWFHSLPQRPLLAARLRELWDHPRFDIPRQYGEHFYFFHNAGLDDHYGLYSLPAVLGLPVCSGADSCDVLPPQARLLLDAASWPDQQQLVGLSFSPDGQRLAYATDNTRNGSRDWWVLELTEVPAVARKLSAVRSPELVWGAQGNGIYHTRHEFDARGRAVSRLLFSSLEEGPRAQKMLTGPEQRVHQEYGEVFIHALQSSADQRVLVFAVQQADGSHRLMLSDLQQRSTPTELGRGFDSVPLFVGYQDQQLFFVSKQESWQGALMAVEMPQPGRPVEWRPITGNGPDRLERAVHTSAGFVVEYLQHGSSVLRVHSLGGEEVAEVRLPAYGRVGSWHLSAEGHDLYFQFSGPVTPDTVIRLDLHSLETNVLWQAQPPVRLDEFVLERIFVPRPQGRAIPVYIAARQDTLLDGTAPALLEAYGGFDIPVDLRFSITRMAWLETGGIHALAGVRGGGEYDEQWYRQGSGEYRQNSIDDFINVSEFLTEQGYTAAAKLAASGASHGGTLVVAAAHQRPALFGAVLPVSGLMDMLRVEALGGAAGWLEEYGDPRVEEDLHRLLSWSPYHQALKRGAHPPTLVTSTQYDPVVSPVHSFKYLAALQHRMQQGDDTLALLRLNPGVQHHYSSSVSELLEEYADRLSFLLEVLAHPFSGGD